MFKIMHVSPSNMSVEATNNPSLNKIINEFAIRINMVLIYFIT